MRVDAAIPKDDNTSLDNCDVKPTRCPFKLEIALFSFLQLGKCGMNQPTAHAEYGESCLHTSVSTLQNLHGIQINRRSESWTHRHGGKTYFNRYWLADEEAEHKALVLLNALRKRRRLKPILANVLTSTPYAEL